MRLCLLDVLERLLCLYWLLRHLRILWVCGRLLEWLLEWLLERLLERLLV